MPHPKSGYRLADGLRVPGTTTIISRFKESGALINWAYECGVQGLDYRTVRDSAANSGTLAHALVEHHIKGEGHDALRLFLREQSIEGNGDAEKIKSRAWSAFESYLSWERQTKLRIVHQEVSMVSETFRFGGTLDAIGEINNALCLLDWKSSAALYADTLLQLAAYKALWEETHPQEPLTGGFHICRFSKEYADFEHRYFAELDTAWKQFLLFRKAYELDKELKRRLK